MAGIGVWVEVWLLEHDGLMSGQRRRGRSEVPVAVPGIFRLPFGQLCGPFREGFLGVFAKVSF